MVNDDAKKIAGRHFSHELRNNTDQLSQGLTLTHEQVSDNYMEGTVDGMIEKREENIPLQDLEK
ncbi:YozQ family protein [Bacillus kwashiorkori]|uniref:YozQ family protein n=1 Tax=Bacillus kwashiorkori TaxID=1522318 RepID=UPI000785E932|nr:YozQ family protein [Bacillus kwashiorkori]